MAGTSTNYTYRKESTNPSNLHKDGSNIDAREQKDDKTPHNKKMDHSARREDIDLRTSLQAMNKAMELYGKCAKIIISASGYITDIMSALEQKQQLAPPYLKLAASEEERSNVPDVMYQLQSLEKVIDLFVQHYSLRKKKGVTSKRMCSRDDNTAEASTEDVLMEGRTLKVEHSENYVLQLEKQCKEYKEQLGCHQAENQKLQQAYFNDYLLLRATKSINKTSSMDCQIDQGKMQSTSTKEYTIRESSKSDQTLPSMPTYGQKQGSSQNVSKKQGFESKIINEDGQERAECLQMQHALEREEHLPQDIKKLKENVKILEDERKNLKKQIEKLQTEAIKSDLKEKEREIKKLKATVASNEKDLKEKDKIVASKEKEIKKKAERINLLEKKETTMAAKLTDKENTIQIKQKEINDKDIAIARQYQDIGKIKTLNEDLDKFKTIDNERQIQIRTLGAKISSLDDELNKSKRDITDKENKIKEQAEQYEKHQKLIMKKDENITELQLTVTYHTKEITMLQNQNRKCEAELEKQYKVELAKQQQMLRTEVDRQKSNLNDARRLLEQVSTPQDKLNSELDTQKAALKSHLDEIGKLKTQVSGFQAELNSKMDKINVLNQQMSNLQTALGTAKAAEEELQKEISSERLKSSSKQKAFETQKLDLNAKIVENSKLTKQVLDLRIELNTSTEKEALQKKVVAANQSIDMKKNDLYTAQSEMKAKMDEISKLKRQVSNLLAAQGTSKEKEAELTKEISIETLKCSHIQKESESQKSDLKAKTKENIALAKQVSDLKGELSASTLSANQTISRIKNELETAKLSLNKIFMWVSSQVPANCIIPLSANEDERIRPIFAQLMHRLNTAINGPDISAKPLSGAEIGRDVGCPVILPCIAASRVGSDANAALSKAKVANAQVILIVFHHLAPHNCKISTPTESRLTDRSIRDKCLAIVDTVFWNGSMYDCQANEIAVNKIQELLMWRISLQKVLELQALLIRCPTTD